MESLTIQRVVSAVSLPRCASQPAGNLASSTSPPKSKLLGQVRQALRARHYSRRTEDAYVMQIKRFIFFHGVRHPAEMGESEINRFLTDLAVNQKVSASTQNQALAALLFLYHHVLGRRGRRAGQGHSRSKVIEVARRPDAGRSKLF